jgi:O-antigen/teichoic acid export membrane protein
VSVDSVVDTVGVKGSLPAPGELERQEVTLDQEPSDAAKLAGGGLVGIIGKIGGQGLGVLGNLIAARMLSPDEYGLYAIGWTIMRMVGLIAPLGLDKGVVYYATRYRDREHARFVGTLRQSIGVALLSGALLGGGVFALAPWIGSSVFHKGGIIPTLRWFAPIFVAYAGLRVAAAATTVSQKVKYSVLSQDILQPSILAALVPILCGIGLGIIGAVSAIWVSYVVALIAAILFMRNLFPEVTSFRARSPLLVKELLSLSIPSAFAGIFGMYMLWTNRLLVGYFCSLEETGIYQAASQIALLLPMIQAAFTLIFMPMATDLYNRGEPKRLDELYKVSTKWALYVSMPFLLVVLVMPEEVITVLFSGRYTPGWSSLLIMMAAQAVNIGSGPIGPLLVMTGHQRRWSIISGVAFGLNLGLSIVLIPLGGIVGAAIGLAVVYVGMFVIGMREVKRLVGIWPYDRRYVKGGVATLFTVGGLLALRWVAQGVALPPLIALFLGGVLSVGGFGGYLLRKGLDEEDREFFWLLRERWNRLRRESER